jgi:thiamine pyrophosphate-dependent acetolactate synthase large subunit-like protein
MATLRGADLVARALARGGTRRLFSLSGNQVMVVYDAAIDARLEIVHTRHEGAAVHMADAWGRLTGEPGVALLTAGPGHANGVGALYNALGAEAPLVLLSGHAPLGQLGRDAFQELRQADVAAPLCKAAWTAQRAATLGEDMARAFRLAKSGRPGPVHVSLPYDLLDAKLDDADAMLPDAEAFVAPAQPLGDAAAAAILDRLARAARPLIFAAPAMAAGRGARLREALRAATGIPVLHTESPRGIADPTLGALPDLLAEADLVLLLGRKLDFTLRFGQSPAFAAGCRFIHVDPQAEALRRSAVAIGDADRLLHAVQADAFSAAEALIALAKRAFAGAASQAAWAAAVDAARARRPAEWAQLRSAEGAVHPLAVAREVQTALAARPEAVLVCDGGEFGQWAQACAGAATRITNGPAGGIGGSIPYAIAASLARPGAPVIATLGDGSAGFYLAEFETAARCGAPFVAVLGNDARWNAEHLIQVRSYGAARAIGCTMQQTRYDLAVAALGGHGEHVTRAADVGAALARALAAGRPACVNVEIAPHAAPVLSRTGTPPGGAH